MNIIFCMILEVLLHLRKNPLIILHKLKLLTNFDVNLISFLGGVINYVLNV